MNNLEKIVWKKILKHFALNLQKSNGMDHYYILMVGKFVHLIILSISSHCKSFSDYCDESSRSIYFPSTNSPENVLETDNGPETEDSSWNQKYGKKYFIMDMGCPHTFEYILVKNTHNHENRDTSSKKLK